jgi:hypothetical protein
LVQAAAQNRALFADDLLAGDDDDFDAFGSDDDVWGDGGSAHISKDDSDNNSDVIIIGSTRRQDVPGRAGDGGLHSAAHKRQRQQAWVPSAGAVAAAADDGDDDFQPHSSAGQQPPQAHSQDTFDDDGDIDKALAALDRAAAFATTPVGEEQLPLQQLQQRQQQQQRKRQLPTGTRKNTAYTASGAAGGDCGPDMMDWEEQQQQQGVSLGSQDTDQQQPHARGWPVSSEPSRSDDLRQHDAESDDDLSGFITEDAELPNDYLPLSPDPDQERYRRHQRRNSSHQTDLGEMRTPHGAVEREAAGFKAASAAAGGGREGSSRLKSSSKCKRLYSRHTKPGSDGIASARVTPVVGDSNIRLKCGVQSGSDASGEQQRDVSVGLEPARDSAGDDTDDVTTSRQKSAAAKTRLPQGSTLMSSRRQHLPLQAMATTAAATPAADTTHELPPVPQELRSFEGWDRYDMICSASVLT